MAIKAVSPYSRKDSKRRPLSSPPAISSGSPSAAPARLYPFLCRNDRASPAQIPLPLIKENDDHEIGESAVAFHPDVGRGLGAGQCGRTEARTEPALRDDHHKYV